MIKILYTIAKNSGAFSLPGFSTIRNKIYERHLKAPGIVVDAFVRVQKLHSTSNTSQFGSELHIGWGVLIDLTGGVTIADRVTISECAKIFTHSHPIRKGSQDWRKNEILYSRLIIEDDVWIASNAVILESVKRIGKGAIISAGSIVTKDIEDFEIVGGIPAKKIGSRECDY